MKKIIYVDMDGVLADFDGAIPNIQKGVLAPEAYLQGFFRNLKVMPNARWGVSELLKMEEYDLFIASKPMNKNVFSATEKFQWVNEHFPELSKKIFLTCDKGHLNGHYLIDDDKERWEKKFRGIFIHFDKMAPAKSWEEIVGFFESFRKFV